MPRIWVVPGCKTGSTIGLSKHSLFRVPKDTVRWKQWENAIPGISKLSSLDVICDKHFKAKDISHEWKKEDENGQIMARDQYKRPRLSDIAVPTKFNESIGKMGIESADYHIYCMNKAVFLYLSYSHAWGLIRFGGLLGWFTAQFYS